MEFEETLVVDSESLIVKSGKSKFEFYFETLEDENLLRSTDGETIDSGIDLIGDMDVNVDTELEIEDI